MSTEKRFVSDIELETITGIKRRTWQKKRLFNEQPRYYKIGAAVRYDLSEVLAWIRERVSDPDVRQVR